MGFVWGSGIVAGGDWVGCCGAPKYFLVGCWVVDVLGMRVGACADELRLMVLGPGRVGGAQGGAFGLDWIWDGFVVSVVGCGACDGLLGGLCFLCRVELSG